MAAGGRRLPDLGGFRHGGEGGSRELAVAFRVLAESARGRGARAATVVTRTALP
jgi:hypothetical protein